MNVYDEAQVDAKRLICFQDLTEVIQEVLEEGTEEEKTALKSIEFLEFDPLEAGYGS